MRCNPMLVNRIHDNDHPYSHIEGPVHLSIRYPADFLKQVENRQHRPGASTYLGRGSGWQDSRDILEQSSTGDMRQALYDAKVEQSVKSCEVTPMRFEQLPGRSSSDLLYH